MHSTALDFLLLSERLEESLSRAEYLYSMLLSAHRLTYTVCYHTVQLFNSSILTFEHGHTAHEFEISHANRIRPLARLCVRCIEWPIPEEYYSCEQDKNRMECINETMKRLWTLYMEMVEGCNICEEHVSLQNGQLLPPCSFLQDAMDCLPHTDENILVQIARLGPETATAWDSNDEILMHQALDRTMMKLAHELSKWKTDVYKTDDDGRLTVELFMDFMFDERSGHEWNEFYEETLFNLLPINRLRHDTEFLWILFTEIVIALFDQKAFECITECMRDIISTFTYHMELSTWDSIIIRINGWLVSMDEAPSFKLPIYHEDTSADYSIHLIKIFELCCPCVRFIGRDFSEGEETQDTERRLKESLQPHTIHRGTDNQFLPQIDRIKEQVFKSLYPSCHHTYLLWKREQGEVCLDKALVENITRSEIAEGIADLMDEYINT